MGSRRKSSFSKKYTKTRFFVLYNNNNNNNNDNNNNIYLKSNIHSIIRYKFSGLYNDINYGIHIKSVQCI